MNRQKLTAKMIEALAPGALVRDATVHGLFVQVGASGVRAFKIQGDLRLEPGAAPVSVRMTLGRFPEMSVERARTEAQRVLSLIKSGVDPRPGAKAPAGAPTVIKLYADWTADLRARGKAERTATDVEERFARYLAAWAQLPVE